MANRIYRRFQEQLEGVTDYYRLLVEETKSKRQVGSTNEWVLDNYYMLSEQEKVLRVELRGKDLRHMPARRLAHIEHLLSEFAEKSYYQVEKHALFEYLKASQIQGQDYLSYSEVGALLPPTESADGGETGGTMRSPARKRLV